MARLLPIALLIALGALVACTDVKTVLSAIEAVLAERR
jgi:hypothetical protein